MIHEKDSSSESNKTWIVRTSPQANRDGALPAQDSGLAYIAAISPGPCKPAKSETEEVEAIRVDLLKMLVLAKFLEQKKREQPDSEVQDEPAKFSGPVPLLLCGDDKGSSAVLYAYNNTHQH